MTTTDYLNQLTQDRDDLVDNLEAKGITGLTGDETFTELVPQVLNIPSGSTINGTLINSKVQSGTINKGDFVKRGDFIIQDSVTSSSNYMLVANATITDEQNLFDNDPNTYALISSTTQTGNPRIYVQCKSRSQLNIPQSALLKNVICHFKADWSILGSSYSRVSSPVKYRDGVLSQYTAGNGIGANKTYPNLTHPGVEDTLTFENGAIEPLTDTSWYGFQVYSGSSINNKISLYYANFDIYYEYEGETKKITDNGEIILGIANQTGTQNDTIQVYIPNVE